MSANDERRVHGRSPWRDAYEMLIGSRSQGRTPSFGITEERAPGGIVVPLFRCDIPVCDEFPTVDAAFTAMLQAHVDFRTYLAKSQPDLKAQLEATIAKGKQ
jgi:hypothetical protein